MTITPLPLIAAPVAHGSGGTSAKGLLGGPDFGALVLEHLARLSGDPRLGFGDPVDPTGAKGSGAPGDETAEETPGKPATAVPPGAAALPVLDAAPAAAAICATPNPPKVVLAPVRETAPHSTPDVEAEAPSVAASALQAGTVAATPSATGVRSAPAAGPVPDPTAPAGPLVAARPGQARSGAPSDTVAPESRVGPGPAPIADVAGQGSDIVAEAVPLSAPVAAHGTAPAAIPGFAWMATPVAPAAAPAGAAVPSAPDAGPLIDQVTPVVSRMVSAGEGSHRMVLRLHPADLGEVHLTVTVRGEDVDVTVAASREARDLLAEGGGQLRTLLDSIGRTTGQVVFRDLPGAAAPVATVPSGQGLGAGTDGRNDTFAGSGPGADDGTGARPGRRDQPDRTAAPGTQPATDRPTPHGNTDVGSARGALDVRI